MSAPALDGVLETSLYVDDVERSVAFYRTIFGFEVVEAGDRLTAVGVAGRQILLLCRKGASRKDVGGHDGQGPLHLAFKIPAGELDAWNAWLADHGVAIEETKHWTRGGVSLYFRDPDGHLLEVATPGVWAAVY